MSDADQITIALPPPPVAPAPEVLPPPPAVIVPRVWSREPVQQELISGAVKRPTSQGRLF